MRIFVTGSSGFVGRNLVKELKRNKKNELYLYKRGENIEVVKDFEPDVIYHLAAELHDEETMNESNTQLTANLLIASERIKYKAFIYTGTSSEYGIKILPMVEDMLCVPTTKYAYTKMIGTIMCRDTVRTLGKNIMVLRPFSLYGRREGDKRFMPVAINACLKEKQFDLWDGNHDWTHIDDFTRALIYFSSKKLPGEIINVGTGVQTSNQDVVRLIEKHCGKTLTRYKHVGSKRAGDSLRWVADTNKAKALGFECEISLDQGINDQVNELRRTLKKN